MKSPAHSAYVGDQDTEHAQAREEASQEHGLASMLLEERFRASQPLRGDEDVAAANAARTDAHSSAHPRADLVPEPGPQDAERDDVAPVEVPPMKGTGGYDGWSRQGAAPRCSRASPRRG